MNQGKYVFAQLINFLTARSFDSSVSHYAINNCIYRNLFSERDLFNYLTDLKGNWSCTLRKTGLISKLFVLHLPHKVVFL